MISVGYVRTPYSFDGYVEIDPAYFPRNIGREGGLPNPRSGIHPIVVTNVNPAQPFIPLKTQMLGPRRSKGTSRRQQKPLPPPTPTTTADVPSVASTSSSSFESGSAALGEPCGHEGHWKRLRVKKGLSQFLCRLCGTRWKTRWNPASERGNHHNGGCVGPSSGFRPCAGGGR